MSTGPMKAEQLRKCAVCGKGVAHAGTPLFYRVHLEPMGLDLREIQRTHAMEVMFPGALGVARMFYDGDVAKPIHEPVMSLVCQPCALDRDIRLAVLATTDEKEPA